MVLNLFPPATHLGLFRNSQLTWTRFLDFRLQNQVFSKKKPRHSSVDRLRNTGLYRLLNYSSLLKLKIYLSLCSFTMRVFRLTYLSCFRKCREQKNFFSLRRRYCGIPLISLISRDVFTKREKSAILFRFCFFFSSEGRQVLKLPHYSVY